VRYEVLMLFELQVLYLNEDIEPSDVLHTRLLLSVRCWSRRRLYDLVRTLDLLHDASQRETVRP